MRFIFADYELDQRRHELRRAGVLIHLEPKVYDLLTYFVTHPNDLVSKHELVEQLWPSYMVTDSSLERCIAKCRRALSTNGKEERFIQTVHGRGYRFIAEIKLEEDTKYGFENSNDPRSTVVRAIEFPPEYHQAGMAILSYFGTVLRYKYPSTPVKVRIEQEWLKVKMVIETPDGKKDAIEECLEEYFLVVREEMPPELLLSKPWQIMDLKHTLEITKLELKQKQDLLQLTTIDLDESRRELREARISIQNFQLLISKALDQTGNITNVLHPAINRLTELKESSMTIFDQRHQRVITQNNAAHDINFDTVHSRTDMVRALEKLQAELRKAREVGLFEEEVATDADYQLTKAVQQAKRPNSDKKTILGHLSEAKELISGVTAASGLVNALVKAMEVIQQLF